MLQALRTALTTAIALAGWYGSATAQVSGQSANGRGDVCRLSGRARLPSGTTLFESVNARRGVARFTGRELDLKVVAPGEGRLEIETGDGEDGVRVHGYVDASAIDFVTRRTLTVIPSQIWIEPEQQVNITQVGPEAIRVEAVIKVPFEARFSAVAACDDVAPGRRRLVRHRVEEGSPYVSRVQSLVLYGAPSSSAGPVATLKPSPALVLWAGERFRDFLRVRYRGAVGIDAWARSGDLLPAPERRSPDEPVEPDLLETEEAPPATPSGARSVTTSRAVTFFDSMGGSAVGTFEPRTRLTVLRTVGSSASVLPLPLELAPLPTREFWVVSSDLEH